MTTGIGTLPTNPFQGASFKGYKFKVKSAETKFGRRTVVHNYPFSSNAFVEDIGRLSKTISFNAYTIGDYTSEERTALMNIIDNDDKNGILVHPTLGVINVQVQGCSHIYRDDKTRIDVFRLVFTEQGNSAFIKLTEDTQTTVQESVSAVLTDESSVTLEFEDNFITDLNSFLKDIAEFDLMDFIDDCLASTEFGTALVDGYNTFITTVDNFRDAIDSIVANAYDLRLGVMQILDDLQKVMNTPLDAYNSLKSILTFGINFDLKFPLSENEDEWTPARIQQNKNRKALKNLIKSVVISEMAKTVSEMEFINKTEALEIRDDMDAVFVEQLEILGNDTDAISYEEIGQLRALFIKDINNRVGTLPEIKVINMKANLPAISIAYNQFEDSDREDEIIDMNKVRNPLFVQRGDIEVLSA